MGIYPRVLRDSYPMNTNMTGFGWFSKVFLCVLVLFAKVASALKGLDLGSGTQNSFTEMTGI